MTTNESSISGGDLIFLVCAVVVSFVLGSVHRLGRSIVRQRRAVDLTDRDVRDLTERCDLQQISVSRLTQELSEMRQALMQQALAIAPVHAAMQASAATRVPPDAPRPSRVVAPAVPPVAAAPRAAPRPADPHALACAGASAEALMSHCGLNRAEADLVLSVHGARTHAA